jgi:hypothetical protein
MKRVAKKPSAAYRRKARANAAQLASAERRVRRAAEMWVAAAHSVHHLDERHDAEIELDVAVQTWRALR